jgi:3-hydroxyisobutyrate dehydrogenase
MGAPMARNLHKAGLLTAVYNRTPEKARTLAAELGCSFAETITELAKSCDAVVLCVSADADLMQLIETLASALKPGALVIDCSTVGAGTARTAAAKLAEREIAFLDCPVSGGTEGAKHGTLAIMCGGDEATFQRAQPILEAMGKRVALMGATGSGQATKAVNQIVVAGVAQAVSEALAFAQAQGLPLDKVIDLVGSGAAQSWFLTNRGPNMMRMQFPLGFKVSLHDKDLDIVQRMAAAQDVQLPVVEMTRIHYRRLIEQGHGGEDISALFRLKQALFKKT